MADLMNATVLQCHGSLGGDCKVYTSIGRLTKLF